MGCDVKKLRQQLQREGWRIEQGIKHYKAYHPKGGFIVMSVSPSCPYAAKNIMGDVRRLKRSHGEFYEST